MNGFNKCRLYSLRVVYLTAGALVAGWAAADLDLGGDTLVCALAAGRVEADVAQVALLSVCRVSRSDQDGLDVGQDFHQLCSRDRPHSHRLIQPSPLVLLQWYRCDLQQKRVIRIISNIAPWKP